MKITNRTVGPNDDRCDMVKQQLCQGGKLVIAYTFTCTCPVAMLERYMGLAGINPSSDLFLFRDNYHRRGKLRPTGQISYSTLRKLFKKVGGIRLPSRILWST